MASFPELFSGAVSLYPLQITWKYPTEVQQFDDLSEQRFRKSAPTTDYVLQLDGLSDTDRDTVEDFFTDSKGGFDSTWDIEVSGDTFSHMMFLEDKLVWTEEPDTPNAYAARIPIKQSRK